VNWRRRLVKLEAAAVHRAVPTEEELSLMRRIVVDGEEPPRGYSIPLAWCRWPLARVTPEEEAAILAEVDAEWPHDDPRW
jgi:hypothetical protein